MLCANQNSDKNLISAKDNADAPEFNQSDKIFLIDNGLFKPMLSIANKLFGRQHLNFDQLTSPEQQLWNLFEKSSIYEFRTGQKVTVPDFKNFLTFLAISKVSINMSKIAEKLVPILPL